MYLEDVVEIAGEIVRKKQRGNESSYHPNRTFTGEVLFSTQLEGKRSVSSIEQKFEDTAQVDGLTVWKSNGEVPFADMLLDFVQIGAITLEQAEVSLLQKQKDTEASLATLFKNRDGNIVLGEGALNYRAERLAKMSA